MHEYLLKQQRVLAVVTAIEAIFQEYGMSAQEDMVDKGAEGDRAFHYTFADLGPVELVACFILPRYEEGGEECSYSVSFHTLPGDPLSAIEVSYSGEGTFRYSDTEGDDHPLVSTLRARLNEIVSGGLGSVMTLPQDTAYDFIRAMADVAKANKS